MNRVLIYALLPFVAGAAAAFKLIAFGLDHLLDPSQPLLVDLVWYGSFGVLFAAFLLCVRVMGARAWVRRSVLVASLIVMAAASFAPRLVDAWLASERAAAEQAEGADVEMEFQSAYLDRADDVDARVAANKPYPPDEAMSLIEFAADSDLTWRGLADHTFDTFALVEHALDAHILDPNALMPGPVADSPPKTLALAFYEKRVRPGGLSNVVRHDFEMLQLLAKKGADLSAPDAAPLRDLLAKPVAPGTGRFIQFQ